VDGDPYVFTFPIYFSVFERCHEGNKSKLAKRQTKNIFVDFFCNNFLEVGDMKTRGKWQII
jgi:hypothetical protein